jgi:hypothetical protein
VVEGRGGGGARVGGRGVGGSVWAAGMRRGVRGCGCVYAGVWCEDERASACAANTQGQRGCCKAKGGMA